MTDRTLTVLASGPLTTVQDRGRTGLAHLGVPRSGAVDEPALRLANRLVGNADGMAGLECTLLGVTLRADAAITVAVTGAPAEITIDGTAAEFGMAVRVPAGTTLRIGRATAGLRSYLAVDGGLTVPAVLGSRSTDTLSGLGPAPLRAGVVLPVGAPTDSLPTSPAQPVRPPTAEPRPRVHPGPRADWFTADARELLLTATYRVSPTSNRIGARLTGPALQRAVTDELPSEGLVLGAVQVPAGGEPLIFLADHPTTGGYPVIAVIDPADIPAVAQARPGTPVRFQAAAGTGWSKSMA